VVILDGASWHNSRGLVAPSNITLLALPPYSPELNPVERIWHYLRSPLARQLGISELGGHHGRLRDGVEPVRHQQRPVRSLCAVAWAPASSAL